jgi:T-complex protein 1 subunit eta
MQAVVAGGGAIEMDLARCLRSHALTIPGKAQLLVLAFAQALEVIPRCLCDNAGLDPTDILTQLRKHHASGDRWHGVDIANEGVTDNLVSFVWEPASMKINLVSAATEAACTILSIDLTIKPAPKQNEDLRSALPGNH